MTTGFKTNTAQVLTVQERYKGFFDSGYGSKPQRHTFYIGERSWRERCLHFDKMYERHGLFKQALLTISGHIIAENIFLQPVVDKATNKPYPRAEEACQLCEDLNQRIHIEELIRTTAFHMAKYGSYFIEKSFSPRFGVRGIPQQEYVEPKEQDAEGNIIKWRQTGLSQVEYAIWSNEDIVHFPWDVSSRTWPYGTSLGTGLDTEFETLESMETNSKDYMEKQAWPYEIYQLGNENYQPTEDQVSTVKSKWKSRNIGENLITTYPSQILQGGTGGSPIRELSELIAGVKENVIDSVMVPPISKLYNSTEASANALAKWTASAIFKPMQNIILHKWTEEIYKPYLEDLGYSVKVCPRMLFESPDAHKMEEGDFWFGAVDKKIATPMQAADALGIKYDEKYWREMERKEQEQFQQKLTSQKQDGDSGEQKQTGKSWKVTELVGDKRE